MIKPRFSFYWMRKHSGIDEVRYAYDNFAGQDHSEKPIDNYRDCTLMNRGLQALLLDMLDRRVQDEDLLHLFEAYKAWQAWNPEDNGQKSE